MRYLLFLAASCVAVSASGGSVPDAPIWRWTPAERVGVRLEHHREPRGGPRVGSLSVTVGTGDARLVIDGQKNPELLMPNELFNALLQGLSDDAQVRAISRQTLTPRIRAFGFDDARFWMTLDQATSSYRDQLRARNRTVWSQTSGARSEGAALQADLNLCKNRAATLESLRHLFRAEGFDRFLYVVVAPTISITADAADETPAHLLSVEGGCQ